MGTSDVATSVGARRCSQRRRYLVVDRVLAIVCVLPTAVSVTVPGAMTDETGAATPSLLFGFLVPEARSGGRDSGLLELAGQPAGLDVFLGLALVAIGLTACAVWVRRRYPEILLGLGVLVLLAFGAIVPIAIGLYTYAAWYTARRNLAIWSAVAAGALVVGLRFDSVSIPFVLLGIVVPTILGLWIGTRRLLVANLRERADQLEREQHLMAERAAADERTRIAREMHDVVAHRVSLMVVHAGGLEVAANDPVVVETAGVIRTTGREALAELRSVLGVLRSGGHDAPTAPQPMLTDLGELVSGWRMAGMAVRLTVTGQVRPLPAGTERTAYRVVQEALTNAARHAPGAAVDIRLRHGERALHVMVVNDPGKPTAAPAPVPPGGFGLVGLRERLSLADGTLDSGAMPGGGWRVQASIPISEASSSPGEPIP